MIVIYCDVCGKEIPRGTEQPDTREVIGHMMFGDYCSEKCIRDLDERRVEMIRARKMEREAEK
jgi:hypothetical protein